MAFGSPILVSVTSFFYGLTAQDVGTGREAFGNAHLLSVIHFELLTVPVVGAVLYVRGWRPKDFPVEITRLTTLLGVAAYAASWLLGKGSISVWGRSSRRFAWRWRSSITRRIRRTS